MSVVGEDCAKSVAFFRHDGRRSRVWKWSSLRGAFSFGDIMFLSESGSGSRELTSFWLSIRHWLFLG